MQPLSFIFRIIFDKDVTATTLLKEKTRTFMRITQPPRQLSCIQRGSNQFDMVLIMDGCLSPTDGSLIYELDMYTRKVKLNCCCSKQIQDVLFNYRHILKTTFIKRRKMNYFIHAFKHAGGKHMTSGKDHQVH